MYMYIYICVYTNTHTYMYMHIYLYLYRVNPPLKGALYAIRLRVSYKQKDETRSRNSLRYLSKAKFTYIGALVATGHL